MSRYGRTDEDWAALKAAGWEFLVSQARLQRTTSYTEMNTVLTRRTGVREFACRGYACRSRCRPVATAASPCHPRQDA
jgi:hypothetical protein